MHAGKVYSAKPGGFGSVHCGGGGGLWFRGGTFNFIHMVNNPKRIPGTVQPSSL